MQFERKRAKLLVSLLFFVRSGMKFLPPEEEIRAQLRELTSKTRRLRADIQGLLTHRGHSGPSFSNDYRHRLKLVPPRADRFEKPPPRSQAPPESPPEPSRKKRSKSNKPR